MPAEIERLQAERSPQVFDGEVADVQVADLKVVDGEVVQVFLARKLPSGFYLQKRLGGYFGGNASRLPRTTSRVLISKKFESSVR